MAASRLAPEERTAKLILSACRNNVKPEGLRAPMSWRAAAADKSGDFVGRVRQRTGAGAYISQAVDQDALAAELSVHAFGTLQEILHDYKPVLDQILIDMFIGVDERGMPRRLKIYRLPMPDRSSICGDYTAPQLIITSPSQSYVTGISLYSATPTALFSGKRMRSILTRLSMRRLNRFLATRRNAAAALSLRPPIKVRGVISHTLLPWIVQVKPPSGGPASRRS